MNFNQSRDATPESSKFLHVPPPALQPQRYSVDMNCSQLYIGTDVPIPESESKFFSVEKEALATDEGRIIQKVLGSLG